MHFDSRVLDPIRRTFRLETAIGKQDDNNLKNELAKFVTLNLKKEWKY